jgi:hypothetical protein
MPPTKKLRQEIQEYSSLLRALKTASTSNLAAHIYTDVPETHAITDGDSLSPQQESFKRRRPSPHPLAKPERELWTRWPLMPDDVYPPTWSLEEEIAAIISDCAKQSDEGNSEDIPSTADCSALAASSLHSLEQTLSRIASNFPVVDKGSHYRLKAGSAEHVLQIVKQEGLFPPE